VLIPDSLPWSLKLTCFLRCFQELPAIMQYASPSVSLPMGTPLAAIANPRKDAPFLVVTTDNGTNIDFMDADSDIAPQHYAFLVSETEFDEIFGRVRERSLPYWADPAQTQADEINHHDGGARFLFRGSQRPLLRSHHPPLRQRRL
jgi:hypothetical protein